MFRVEVSTAKEAPLHIFMYFLIQFVHHWPQNKYFSELWFCQRESPPLFWNHKAELTSTGDKTAFQPWYQVYRAAQEKILWFGFTL